MEQMPLHFVMDDNRTYEKTDADEVWRASDQPAFENRRWTVQLTIFADESALPPLLMFRDKGLRINSVEKKRCYRKMKITLKPKGWCD